MISYAIYKVLHLSSWMIYFVIMAQASIDLRKTKFRVIFSGIALVFALVSGFGMMARLGVPHGSWPAWIWVKFVSWAILGAFGHSLLKRKPQLLKKYMAIAVFIYVAVSYIVISKPF